MRSRHPHFSLIVALLGAAIVLSLDAGGLAQGGRAPAPLRRLAGKQRLRRLPVAEHPVREFTFGADRQPIVRSVNASAIWVVGRAYYVRVAGASDWLVGRRASGGKTIECNVRFPSLEAMVAASAYKNLPEAPAGMRLREVVRLPDFPVRLASDGTGKTLYVLMVNGDVYRLDVRGRRLQQVLKGDDYHEVGALQRQSLGLMLDGQGRLHIASNERLEEARPITNRVTIFRAQTRLKRRAVDAPQIWLRTSYPWGIGAFNHGVNHMAIGPDGLMYVSSGSRTDGNEPGDDPKFFKGGETPTTAALWRLDPKAEKPTIEIYARGLRNAFGFCWMPGGDIIATDNGPNANAPGELNIVREGRHYGFPFEFADWEKKPYAHTPDPPAGQTFERPILSVGPAGGASAEKPLSTVDAHSSPGGIVYVGDDFPARYRGGYFFSRFGDLLEGSKRVGYDLLFARVRRRADGLYQARIETVLEPLARPVDIHLSGTGKLYILEYSRQHDNQGFSGNLPGRVLELSFVQ